MKPETVIMDKMIGGSGTSILRAAAKAILDSLVKTEAIEGEEAKIESAIGEVASGGGMQPSLVAAMLISSIAQSYVAQKTGQMPDMSKLPAVGNC